MDSDQSEELFSDDDNLENIGDSSVKFPEADPCSYARSFNNYSPYQVNSNENSAEVPTTPLSLIPHISSVTPKWTSDMETPDADLEKRLAGPSNRYQNHHENQVNNQCITNFSITKTPVPHDSPSSDEIIPGSQDKYKKRKRKRPSRRILTNISNNSYSDDDLHQSRNSQDFVNDRDSDEFSDDKLSPIKEYSIEERGDDNFREINKENRQSADINPAERIRQLRELQNSLRLSQKNNLPVIDIPESEFSKKFRALESNCQSFSQCQKNSTKKVCKKTGLIPFSHMNQCNDDHDNDDDDEQNYLSRSISKLIDEPFHTPAENDNKDYLFNKTIGKVVDEPLDSQTQDIYDNDDFLGFSVCSQENSKLKCSKHKDFIRLSKRWKILDGFSFNEIEQSENFAQSYNRFYVNYLNEKFPIARKKMVDKYFEQKFSVTNILPVIKMSLKQWFNTASGKELFVSVNAVSCSELVLLEDDNSEHSIDNLLVNNFNKQASDIASFSSEENVANDTERNSLERLKSKGEQEVENENYDKHRYKKKLDNQLKSQMDKNPEDEVSFNGSSSTTIKISQVQDAIIKIEHHNIESNQSTQCMDVENIENFNDNYGFKFDRVENENASEENLNTTNVLNYEEGSLTQKLDTSNKNSGFNEQVLTNSLPSSSIVDKIVKLEEDSLLKDALKIKTNIQNKNKEEEEEKETNLQDIPINSELIGFQTGRGKRINVPETALQKANNMFADEEQMILDTENYSNDFEFIQPLPSKKIEKKNFLNSIDSNRSELKLRRENQSNLKANFVDIDKNTENIDNKNNGTPKNPPMIIGFQTGRGKNIKVPDIALSKAKNIFLEEDLDDFSPNLTTTKTLTSCQKNINVPETTLSVEKNIFGDDISLSHISIGFKTGHGKNIKISENALLKANLEMSEEIELDKEVNLENMKNLNRENRCLKTAIELPNTTSNIDTSKKRKYRDEETPVGRKRSKLGLDLQRRKLFDGIEEEDETLMKAAMEFDECDVNNSERNLDKTKWQSAKSSNLGETVRPSTSNDITDEVLDSVAAFFMEETNEIGDKWANNEDNYSSRKLPRSRTSVGSFLYLEESDKLNESKSTKRPRSYPGSSEPISVTIGNSKSPVKSPKHDSIPEELFFDTQFSQGGTSTFTLEQIQEQRLAATLEQENIILHKKRIKVKPITGSLLHLKQTNTRISLKNYLQSPPNLGTFEDVLNGEIDIQVMSINSSNAEKYRFDLTKHFGHHFMMSNGGVPIGDGAMLIPNEDNLTGVDEFKKCFLASPGVDPSLLHNRWVENHYRWIVWKLASMERLKVSRKWSEKFLTPDRVMKQLKYRYDREIDRSERSALRRILEKDDAPTRRMVLCVSKVYEDNAGQDNKCKAIELTDGWYSIPAIVDYAMVPYINSGKVKEGTKLMIFGAELVNHDEGRHPLDVTDDVRLRIHTNSTRRARWDVKLGYQQQSDPMPINLTGIKSNGGNIGKFTVATARVYPVLFREKIANGQSIVRNARCEEKAAIAYERECQSRIESICYKAQQSDDSTSNSDLEYRVKNNLPERRNVTTILKIKVADNNHSATLTVWSCDEELQSIFKENTCITIYNAVAAGKRMNELHITAGRSTIFERATLNRNLKCSPRIFTSLEDILLPGFNPEYGEFDTVGVVVSVGPAPHGMKNFETVNIAYKKQDDEDSPSFYLSILFWKGVSSHGFAEIATVGAFLACINLEWRKNTYRSIPTAFCTERTLLTRNPRQAHLRQPFDLFCNRIQDIPSYIESSSSIIQSQIEKKYDRSTPGCNTPTLNSDRKRSLNAWTPENRDYSLVNPDSVPRNESRKMAILNRLEKLQRYGEAPELSSIHLGQSSRVSLDYQSPVAQLPKSMSNT